MKCSKVWPATPGAFAFGHGVMALRPMLLAALALLTLGGPPSLGNPVVQEDSDADGSWIGGDDDP